MFSNMFQSSYFYHHFLINFNVIEDTYIQQYAAEISKILRKVLPEMAQELSHKRGSIFGLGLMNLI